VLAPIDGEKVNGKETVGVKVAMKDKPEIRLFFEKGSGLLVKTAHKAKAQEQGFEEVDEVHMVQKYQDVEGAKFPAEIVITRNGEKYMQVKYTKVEPVKEFPQGTFDEPK